MNKKELTDYLENRLSVLNKSERDDIIGEYIQHIDNKLAEGLTEKEAVRTLGNIEDMVREILSAYNVDPDYKSRRNENEINTVVTGAFGRFASFIKSIGDYILGQRAINLLKLTIKALILLCVLLVCYCIGLSIAAIFADAISNIVGGWYLFRFLANFVYTIIALPTVIYIFIRFMTFNIYGGKEQFENRVNARKQVSAHAADGNSEKAVKKGIFTKNNDVMIEKKNDYGFFNCIRKMFDFTFGLFILTCKAVVIMCIIPFVFMLLFAVICFGALLVFMFLGYPIIGAALAALGFCMAGISFLLILIKLIFLNKGEVKANEEIL